MRGWMSHIKSNWLAFQRLQGRRLSNIKADRALQGIHSHCEFWNKGNNNKKTKYGRYQNIQEMCSKW